MKRCPLFALALAAALGACCKHGPAGNNQIVGVDGLPSATPNPLDFGVVGTGTTHKLGLTLSNVGTGPLTVQGASVSGDSSFALPAVGRESLQVGQSFTLSVTCTPQTDGPHTATLTFTTDSSAKPSYAVPLSCTAFAYKVEVSPIELDFGDVQVGTTSAPKTVTVTNDASAQETIGLSLAGLNATDFQASPASSQNVPAGGSFPITVTFAPTSAQAETATLQLTACNGCTPVTVTLTGTGVDTQIVLIDADNGASYFDFGSVPQGVSPAPFTRVVAKAISVPAGVSAPLLATLTAPPSLQTGNDGFTVTAADANFNQNASAWPATLDPSGVSAPATANLIVTYNPTGSASVSDAVQVPYQVVAVTKSPAQFPVSAGEAGSPCSQVVATPSSVAFGSVLSGQTGTKTVTLTNNGTALCQLSNVAIAPNDAFNEFGLQGGPYAQVSLNPGQSQPFTVTFTPATGTPPLLRKADLSMTTNDTTVQSITVPLSGLLQNPAYAPTAWPKWHHDNGNTGLTTADTSGNQGQVAWKVPIGVPVGASGALATYIDSPSIGQDPSTQHDIVYMLGYGTYNISNVYANTAPGAGQFVAVDGPSGTTLWSTPVTGPENSAQEATPTIVADNSIYLMTGGEQTSYPEFYHISPSGQVLWSGVQAIGGTTCACTFDSSGKNTCATQCSTFKINDGFDTCPGFDNTGILYLFDDDQPGCDTYSSSTAQPTLQWSTKETQEPAHVESFSAALTSVSQSVFSWGGYVVSFDATGNQRWGMATGNGQMTNGWAAKGAKCENDSKGSPAIDGSETDAVVAFGGFDPTCANIIGGIVGVNLATGKQDWGFQFPSGAPPAAPYNTNGYGSALVGYSSPASMGNGNWVMGWLDGVYAFSMPSQGTGTATQLWHATTGLVLSSPAVGGDGTVFVGSSDGNFYAINGSSGQIKWKVSVGAAVNSSPAIGSDGSVYFAADDGNLYAVR